MSTKNPSATNGRPAAKPARASKAAAPAEAAELPSGFPVEVPDEEPAKLKKKNSGKDVSAEAPLSSRRICVPTFPYVWRRVVIEGITPLLTNAISDRVLDKIAADQAGKKEAKKPRIPEQEYYEHHHICYGVTDDISKLPEALCGFPAVGLKKALVQVIGVLFGRAVQNQFAPWVWVNGPYNGLVPITKEPVHKPTHEAFMKARAPSTLKRDATFLYQQMKGRIMTPCYRPMFFPWFMTLDIRYNSDVLHEEDLMHAMTALGNLTTFGSYRVARGGDFGRFTVESIQGLPNSYTPIAKWGPHVTG
jgi:hypothetical protein